MCNASFKIKPFSGLLACFFKDISSDSTKMQMILYTDAQVTCNDMQILDEDNEKWQRCGRSYAGGHPIYCCWNSVGDVGPEVLEMRRSQEEKVFESLVLELALGKFLCRGCTPGPFGAGRLQYDGSNRP